MVTNVCHTNHCEHHDDVGSNHSVDDKHLQYTENPQNNIKSIHKATIFELSTVMGYGDTHYESNVENQTGSEIDFIPMILPPT